MKIECPTCYGKKEVAYSCCTGEPVHEDILMCSVCYEHLGEEECQTCEGTGEIDDVEDSI